MFANELNAIRFNDGKVKTKTRRGGSMDAIDVSNFVGGLL